MRERLGIQVNSGRLDPGPAAPFAQDCDASLYIGTLFAVAGGDLGRAPPFDFMGP